MRVVHTIAQHRAAESRLLGHDVELGLGETGGEAIEKGLVSDDWYQLWRASSSMVSASGGGLKNTM